METGKRRVRSNIGVCATLWESSVLQIVYGNCFLIRHTPLQLQTQTQFMRSKSSGFQPGAQLLQQAVQNER